MLRVKMLKDNKHGKKGAIVVMDNNEAFGLCDMGVAMITKDITESDEVQADGKSIKLRTN